MKYPILQIQQLFLLSRNHKLIGSMMKEEETDELCFNFN